MSINKTGQKRQVVRLKCELLRWPLQIHEGWYLRPKKVVFFPEIGRVKSFYQLSARISRMCMRIYIFRFKNTHTIQLANYSYEFTFFP